MRIAIHHRPGSFSDRWIEYCKLNKIEFGLVNCYASDIVKVMDDYDALLWHFHQGSRKDVLFAKQLFYSLETAGKKVFPDFHTSWHFDDKLGQKYLLEAAKAPLVPSYAFYEKREALEWVEETDYPKVFKLRRGSGSDHVRLVRNKREARRLVKKAFGSGFKQYDAFTNLKERVRKFRVGKAGVKDVLKGVVRLGYTTDFARVIGNERGYIYFQDFIPDNDHDLRINVVNGKAFAVRREVRKDDFRASGSGYPKFEKHYFPDEVISIAQEVAKNLKLQAVAFDFLRHKGSFVIAELSYAFCDMTNKCTGYWDEDGKWHPGEFHEEDWMIECLLNHTYEKSLPDNILNDPESALPYSR